MAGRKRKVQDLAVAAAATHTESGLLLRRNQTELNCRASPAKPKSQPVLCESVQSLEPERSHYFNYNEPQRRLGQDFFNQPCISLAKAFLGKVPLKSVFKFTWTYLFKGCCYINLSRVAQQFLEAAVFV